MDDMDDMEGEFEDMEGYGYGMGGGGYRTEQNWKPEELSSLILFKMKKMAETHLGSLVKDAVLTVPALFNISQRLATKEAGLLAGLNVIGILEEPMAAAIAYGLDKESSKGNILIVCQGNGTLDVSIMITENHILRVKSTIVEKIREQMFVDVTNMTKERIEEIAARVSINKMFLDPVKRVMQEAKTDQSTITDLITVGLLTRTPSEVVQKLLQNFFPGSKLHTSIHPQEVLATGAAIVASRLTAGNTNVVSEDDGGAAASLYLS